MSLKKLSVKKVAWHLSGSASVGGTDSHALHHWLLRSGAASQVVIGKIVDWQWNSFLPWAAFLALMARQLCDMDKGSGGGAHPLYVGEISQRLLTRCLLFMAGSEAKEVCGIDQLCAGLEAGIKGGIHAMQDHV